MTMNIEDVPRGLVDMLREFTLSVLRSRPADLHQFAAEYFAARARESTANRPAPTSSSTSAVPMYIVVDDNDDDGVVLPPPKPPTGGGTGGRYKRRQSICGESYNPEMDTTSDRRVVYPKTDSQKKDLVDSVRTILLFRCLEPEQLDLVVDAMFERKVKQGDHVIEQGDDGDNFYVIQSGTFDVMLIRDNETKRVHQFVDKGSFGELALLYNMPRSASVIAGTDGTLWAMDRDSFRRIVLRSAYLKRKNYEQLLQSVPMLESLDNYERMTLADALTSYTFSAGQCIIREGDPADGMYFIEEGQVRVTITKKGRETEVKRMDKGRYFGELALVENSPRTATIYAVSEKVKVAFLERESFERLLGPCMDIMKRKMKTYQKSS